jgi:hypothetical protein
VHDVTEYGIDAIRRMGNSARGLIQTTTVEAGWRDRIAFNPRRTAAIRTRRFSSDPHIHLCIYDMRDCLGREKEMAIGGQWS